MLCPPLNGPTSWAVNFPCMTESQLLYTIPSSSLSLSFSIQYVSQTNTCSLTECRYNHRVLGDNKKCHNAGFVIFSPAAVHYTGYQRLWFQAIIALLLNNCKRGGDKSQRCQDGRKMDASVFNAVRSGGVWRLEDMMRPSQGDPPHTHTHTRVVDDGPQAEGFLAWWSSNRPWHMCFPWIPAVVFVDLWVCVCPHVCVFCAKQPSVARKCSFACQLLADLVQKRMQVVCLCRRVNLWIRSDYKTYRLLGKI